MENVIKGALVHKKELKNRRPQRKYEYNRDVRARREAEKNSEPHKK
jgi:hypothetical protein